jgi:hypothetical protein
LVVSELAAQVPNLTNAGSQQDHDLKLDLVWPRPELDSAPVAGIQVCQAQQLAE